MQTGFVGLGAMGRPMAQNLMKGGHELRVWARRAQATKPLTEAGAQASPTPALLAAHCQVVFTMVTKGDVEQVVLGPDGIIHGAKPGTIVIDCSTIAPATTRRIGQALAEKGMEMLDARVSGGEKGRSKARCRSWSAARPRSSSACNQSCAAWVGPWCISERAAPARWPRRPISWR